MDAGVGNPRLQPGRPIGRARRERGALSLSATGGRGERIYGSAPARHRQPAERGIISGAPGDRTGAPGDRTGAPGDRTGAPARRTGVRA